jgi:hypothetical protein
MNSVLRGALALSAAAIATQAAAQVTFYEHQSFQGQSFTTEQQIGNLERSGFNNRASSLEVRGERGRFATVPGSAASASTCVQAGTPPWARWA